MTNVPTNNMLLQLLKHPTHRYISREGKQFFGVIAKNDYISGERFYWVASTGRLVSVSMRTVCKLVDNNIAVLFEKL